DHACCVASAAPARPLAADHGVLRGDRRAAPGNPRAELPRGPAHHRPDRTARRHRVDRARRADRRSGGHARGDQGLAERDRARSAPARAADTEGETAAFLTTPRRLIRERRQAIALRRADERFSRALEQASSIPGYTRPVELSLLYHLALLGQGPGEVVEIG